MNDFDLNESWELTEKADVTITMGEIVTAIVGFLNLAAIITLVILVIKKF